MDGSTSGIDGKFGNVGKSGADTFGRSGISDVATDDENDGDDEEDDNNDPVPAAQWPISIRDEDGKLEEVIHPGHKAKGHPDGTFKCCIQIFFAHITCLNFMF